MKLTDNVKENMMLYYHCYDSIKHDLRVFGIFTLVSAAYI